MWQHFIIVLGTWPKFGFYYVLGTTGVAQAYSKTHVMCNEPIKYCNPNMDVNKRINYVPHGGKKRAWQEIFV